MSRRIVEDVTLVASELIGTASVRDDGTVELRLLVVDGDVRLEVICSREDHSDLRGHDDAASGVLARACVNKVVARWGMFAGASHVWAWVDDDS